MTDAAASLLGKIASYTEILAKDPRSTVFVNLSDAYRKMNLLDDAQEVAQKGIAALPFFCPGYAILGRIQAEKGELDEAAKSFEKALQVDPAYLNALKGLARIRFLQGDRDASRELLMRGAEVRPEDPALQKMLQALGPVPAPSAHVENKAPEKTTSEQGQAVAGGSSAHLTSDGAPISTATIAELYVRQGFYRKALKVYRDLLQANPHNEEVRQKLVALKKRIQDEVDKGKLGQPPGEPAAAQGGDAAVLEEVPQVGGALQVDETPGLQVDSEDVPTVVEYGVSGASFADAIVEDASRVEIRSAEQSVLETLEQFLDSIRSRRANV